jgi:predicted AAA+ superfamily ATPase
MSDSLPHALAPLLQRIADALDRLAPKAAPEPDFAAARLYRYDLDPPRFVAAPDYALPMDLLVGVERQKDRFAENLRRFADGQGRVHERLRGSPVAAPDRAGP